MYKYSESKNAFERQFLIHSVTKELHMVGPENPTNVGPNSPEIILVFCGKHCVNWTLWAPIH